MRAVVCTRYGPPEVLELKDLPKPTPRERVASRSWRKARLQAEGSLTAGGLHITVDDSTPRLRAADLPFLTELVEAGRLKPVIDRSYALEQIVEAHRYVDEGHKKGNVVIAVGAQGRS
jgi:NADPH:quinone reductase-like Zn-dependent oxidoreductase